MKTSIFIIVLRQFRTIQIFCICIVPIEGKQVYCLPFYKTVNISRDPFVKGISSSCLSLQVVDDLYAGMR